MSEPGPGSAGGPAPEGPRPPTRIAPLYADDWAMIREIRLRALADAPQAFTSSYEREQAFEEATWRDRATTCQWFVAFDGERPVAVAGGIPSWSDDPTRRDLVGMWVAPSHRRRSIADGLLHEVADWARSEGASTLRLAVLEGNGEARSAYLKMGLRPAGVATAVADDRSRTIEFMELDLDADC